MQPHPETNGDLADVLKELAALPHEAAKPAEFWPRYLACLGEITGAEELVLLARGGEPSAAWKRMAAWPADLTPSRLRTQFNTSLVSLADAVIGSEQFCRPLDSTTAYVSGVRIELSRPQDQCVILGLLPDVKERDAREAALRMKLASGPPREFLLTQSLRQAQTDVERSAAALDTTLLVNAEKHFLAAALALCNSLAGRHGCERVSLGWNEHDRVRLVAVSRMEKFDRQMEAARALEVAMEEALDQDDEVVWPPAEESTVVSRDHEAFAKGQGVSHLASLPLRLDGDPLAVLTCEREDRPFETDDLKEMRLCGDVVARRLVELKKTSRWFGVRWVTAGRENLAKLVGPERTWMKAFGILVAVLLIVLIFGRFMYRVEGDFLLRSEEVAYLTAPFDGYIQEVSVRPGDVLPAGGRVLALRTSELELQESSALADLERYQRESEKARAAGALAEMRVAQALADQARSQLELVRYRIAQAELKSPFEGVVVEGDLRDRLGAPVKKADVLLKVARLDTLYVEAEINERDVHELRPGATGELAFVSQPKMKFPIKVVTIEKAAVPKENANVFLIRCEVEGGTQPWWRPGMSGLCKINVEKRSLLWIVTHRTIDFLRMKLWW